MSNWRLWEAVLPPSAGQGREQEVLSLKREGKKGPEAVNSANSKPTKPGSQGSKMNFKEAVGSQLKCTEARTHLFYR